MFPGLCSLPSVPTDSHAGLDHDLDPDALKSELQDMVSSGLNPLLKIYRVIVVDELPHTASGKLVRRILRDRMKSGDQASVAQRCAASQF